MTEPITGRSRPIGMTSALRVSGWLLAVAVLSTTSGCAGDTELAASAGQRPRSAQRVEPASGQVSGPFDALTFSLRLRSNTVGSGGVVESRLVVENSSGQTVVDPGCNIASGRSGLVPVSDPDAELWLQVTVDCVGPFSMEPGFRDESSGPEFYAHTKYGVSLPPGEYLAMIEIDGLSTRLSAPVTIE